MLDDLQPKINPELKNRNRSVKKSGAISVFFMKKAQYLVAFKNDYIK
jgi:hypothetical protein